MVTCKTSLAPYVTVLLPSLGVLYAILVAPSPLSFARRAPSGGHLVPHKPPLGWIPSWILNSFIFIAPLTVLIAVLIPGVRLVKAVKNLEDFSIAVLERILVLAAEYDKGILPDVASQAAFLESLVVIEMATNESINRWRPLYGVW